MTLQDSANFSPRTLALLIFAGVFAFAGAAFFSIFDDGSQTSGTNSFSKSAIGHAAFLELLRGQNIPVIVSRSNSVTKANDSTLLIVAEPLQREITKGGGLPLAERTLLVLPKRYGFPALNRPSWVQGVGLLPVESVERILSAFLPNATVSRVESEPKWKNTSLADLHKIRPGQLDNDLLWAAIRSRGVPAIDRPQLIASEDLIPIVASGDGILVGGVKLDSGWVFVISDPDILANHGIGKENNAALLFDLLSLFRPADGSIIIDETVHGFRSNPNLWRQVFEVPFIVPTLLALVAFAILLCAATGRFGSPISPARQSRESEMGLIENAADLLQEAGHGTAIVRRYPTVALRTVAQRLHAPRRLNETELIAWIDRVGTTRNVRRSYRTLQDEIEKAMSHHSIDDERVLRMAQNLHQWKQEMLDGPGRNSGN